MPNYWIENAMQPGKHVLVDCGRWERPATQHRVCEIRAHVALTNLQRVGNDRLVVRLPPKKATAVLAAIPEIKEGVAGYCWCTHGFAPNAGGNSAGTALSCQSGGAKRNET